MLPRRDASALDVQVLLRSGQRGFLDKPSRATGWVDRRSKRGGWWRCTILREVGDDEAEAGAFRAGAKIVDTVQSQLDKLVP